MRTKPNAWAKSLVYCANIPGYLTKEQYEKLTANHRRSINMVLKVNGEYVDSPCIPAGKYPIGD